MAFGPENLKRNFFFFTFLFWRIAQEHLGLALREQIIIIKNNSICTLLHSIKSISSENTLSSKPLQ